ncbi:unnamed protein product [Schistocephalus solidus]|uniref:S ribonuclease n=1 Tax=Schistocephalus solidus TaxID=70667 RepID=A0A183TA03_SCHSO|nr:unnamed protein product [Schistocephalus solidus]
MKINLRKFLTNRKEEKESGCSLHFEKCIEYEFGVGSTLLLFSTPNRVILHLAKVLTFCLIYETNHVVLIYCADTNMAVNSTFKPEDAISKGDEDGDADTATAGGDIGTPNVPCGVADRALEVIARICTDLSWCNGLLIWVYPLDIL